MKYVKSEDMTTSFYSSEKMMSDNKFRRVVFDFPESADTAAYYIAPGNPSQCLTRDDAILISFLLWQTTKTPGENPVYYSNYDAFKKYSDPAAGVTVDAFF